MPEEKTTDQPADLGKLARILEAALERSAQLPVVMDIRKVASFADSFVLLSGRSDRQVRAIAEAIVDALRQADDPPLGVEGLDQGRWVLIDCNDVIVHVFEEEIRDLYALERLWSDATSVDLSALGISQEAIESSGTAAASRPVQATETAG